MIRRLLLILCTAFLTLRATSQQPMYVVNGCVVQSIDSIPHEDIESIDVLPADEQTIATWGMAASEGVIIVTLHYDTPARFTASGEDNYTDYLMSAVKWDRNMPAARVSLRITVGEDGRATISEVLQSTSRQFLGRVERAIEQSPLWEPAMRDGRPVTSMHLVNIQLPEGKELPREYGVILR